MRNEKWWCGAKNNEAPRSINRAMPESSISVTSHQSLVTPNPQSLIPSHSSLLSNLAYGRLRPLVMNESFARMRNEEWWCGAKYNKAPLFYSMQKAYQVQISEPDTLFMI